MPAPASNPFPQERCLDRDFASPLSDAPSQAAQLSSPVWSCLPPALGPSRAREPGCLRLLLGADDAAGPGLVLVPGARVGDDHLHGLCLLLGGMEHIL